MKLSVVIACQAENGLERSIDSVLAQPLAEREIIVVDDASTDGTAALAETFTARGEPVTCVRLETRRGIAAARNEGLARARGDYVSFLDAGDAWEAGAGAKVLGDLELFPWADGIELALSLSGAAAEPHPQQLALVASGLAGNLLLRRSFAASLGGFPTAGALVRGGEVVAFRIAARRWGTIGTGSQVHLEHSARACPLYEHVMRTTRVAGGRIESDPPDAEARALEAAIQDHVRTVDARMLEGIGNPRLHRIACEVAGRAVEFDVPDRPEIIGQATAALAQSEYPMLPFLGSVQTILDVGAGAGAHTVHFACHHPAARVIALEPTQFNFVLLRRNTLANPRIETYRAGLYNTTTRLDLVGPGGRERALFADPGLFLQSLRIDRIDILRLDNSGQEMVALLALGDRLKETKAIIVAYHRDADRRMIDEMLTPTHLLYWGRSPRPQQGEILYVQRALLGPDGRA
jgi:FkbM family methyltransferase